ncbi:aminotransferase class I/II-fold pyridoxal phosphate-dependent enzyme [Streptomyces sp. NPDC026672]|uniref:aminotransferase class I/II-fold pyridoxal phosphate-dependent enzyme n=1 Tax=unclassified Streptomyces TaxID=2593676 RepID=UPI0033F25EE6
MTAKAVILAAGMGRRLGLGRAKSLTEVAGKSILARALENLAAAQVREVVVATGHFADDVRAAIGDTFAGMRIHYVENGIDDRTNNAYSLWLAREHLDQDVLLIEGDILFDLSVVERLREPAEQIVMAVAPYQPSMDGTVVMLDAEGTVTGMMLSKDQDPAMDLTGTFKTVNAYLLRERYLREEFVPALEKLIDGGGSMSYFEQVVADTVTAGSVAVRAVDCRDARWYEVDTLTDLEAAEYLFRDADERLSMLHDMHGGYWRHEVTDHCLLYNLYFPPPEMLDGLAREFRESLVHYPVGQRNLDRLLGAALGQPSEQLAVANGASELIKILGRTTGRTGVVVPGFNEYEAAYSAQRLHRISLPHPGFTVDPHFVADEARRANLSAVVVTSPNNPTSMAVPRTDLVLLAKLLAELDVRLVVDESFADFCSPEQSLEPDLREMPNVVVVKSMSKAYGIAGLRLGYLNSADLDFVSRVRDALPIWNVNGVAEGFLRLLPRHRQAFRESCERVARDRDELARRLAELPGVTVLPAAANFVMLRLPDGVSASTTVRRMFSAHGILIKGCEGKSMTDGDRYLRVACRTPEENTRLTEALAHVLTTGAPAHS